MQKKTNFLPCDAGRCRIFLHHWKVHVKWHQSSFTKNLGHAGKAKN